MNNKLAQEIGHRIATARGWFGWDIRRLAFEIVQCNSMPLLSGKGDYYVLTAEDIDAFERGEREANAAELCYVADALRVDFYALLFGPLQEDTRNAE